MNKQAYLRGFLKTAATLSSANLQRLITGLSKLKNRPVLAVKPGKRMDPLLFYRSRHGTAGKTQGTWYPFFGYDTKANGSGWFIKGHAAGWKGDPVEQMNAGYHNPRIKAIMGALNTHYGPQTPLTQGAPSLPYASLAKQTYGRGYEDVMDSGLHIRKLLRRAYRSPDNMPPLPSRVSAAIPPPPAWFRDKVQRERILAMMKANP